MRAAMVSAEVGDDVYGEDPTVRRLEERVAELFGFEAALFTVTGSLANLLAVRALVGVGEEVLCESSAHIARAELGRTRGTDRADYAHVDTTLAGTPTSMPSKRWSPPTSGRSSSPPRRSRSRTPTTSPAAASSRPTGCAACAAWPTYGAACPPRRGADLERPRRHRCVACASSRSVADTAGVCLSKGLGAPVGSLMLGSADQVAEARVWRKRLGGGWRQAGVLAAAGLYAVDHHVDRLADDHDNARLIAEAAGVDPCRCRHQHRGGPDLRRGGPGRALPGRGRAGRPWALTSYGW